MTYIEVVLVVVIIIFLIYYSLIDDFAGMYEGDARFCAGSGVDMMLLYVGDRDWWKRECTLTISVNGATDVYPLSISGTSLEFEDDPLWPENTVVEFSKDKKLLTFTSDGVILARLYKNNELSDSVKESLRV